MTYRLVVNSQAEKDFTDAVNYYLTKSISTAEKFITAVEEAHGKLKENPQFYSYFHTSQRVRSISLKPFPYQVIFAIRNDEVLVVALHHSHRDPATVLNRIDS